MKALSEQEKQDFLNTAMQTTMNAFGSDAVVVIPLWLNPEDSPLSVGEAILRSGTIPDAIVDEILEAVGAIARDARIKRQEEAQAPDNVTASFTAQPLPTA